MFRVLRQCYNKPALPVSKNPDIVSCAGKWNFYSIPLIPTDEAGEGSSVRNVLQVLLEPDHQRSTSEVRKVRYTGRCPVSHHCLKDKDSLMVPASCLWCGEEKLREFLIPDIQDAFQLFVLLDTSFL